MNFLTLIYELLYLRVKCEYFYFTLFYKWRCFTHNSLLF